MLDLMRKHSKSWVTAVIIGCIAMVFVFWGVSSTWNRTASKNFEINGETITQADIDIMATTMAARLQTRYGSALSKEILDQMVNDKTVVPAVLNDRLMQQAANKWGFYVSDEALSRLIGRDPLFQRNGRFDLGYYQDLLASLNMTETSFENHTRRQMAAGMVNNLLGSLATVTPRQARERYHLRNDQIRVEYLFFDRSGFLDGLTASEEDLNDFFQKNGARWRLPAKIKVNMVHLNAGDLVNKEEVQVSEDELTRFYGDNPGRFHTPPKAEVAHLLLLLPSAQPNEEQLAELRQKAQALLERSQTEDFADLVREYSQDTETTSVGGILGWYAPGELMSSFDEMVFPQVSGNQSYPASGSVLGPVRSPFGYHLIKILAREPEKKTTFAEAKDVLLSELKLNKTRNLAWNTMLTLQDNARGSQDLGLSAKIQNLPVTPIDWFTLDNPDQALKGLDTLLASAFQGAKGDILDLAELEGSDDFYLVEVTDRQESIIPPLDQVKLEVIQAWKEVKANELALAAARDFLVRARETDWNQAKDNLLAAAPSGQAPLTGLTDDFGYLDESVQGVDLGLVIFQLAQVGQWADQPVPSTASSDKAGWYVLRLNKIQPADEQLFEDQKNLWTAQVNREKTLDFIEGWLKEAWEGKENKISSSGT